MHSKLLAENCNHIPVADCECWAFRVVRETKKKPNKATRLRKRPYLFMVDLLPFPEKKPHFWYQGKICKVLTDVYSWQIKGNRIDTFFVLVLCTLCVRASLRLNVTHRKKCLAFKIADWQHSDLIFFSCKVKKYLRIDEKFRQTEVFEHTTMNILKYVALSNIFHKTWKFSLRSAAENELQSVLPSTSLRFIVHHKEKGVAFPPHVYVDRKEGTD